MDDHNEASPQSNDSIDANDSIDYQNDVISTNSDDNNTKETTGNYNTNEINDSNTNETNNTTPQQNNSESDNVDLETSLLEMEDDATPAQVLLAKAKSIQPQSQSQSQSSISTDSSPSVTNTDAAQITASLEESTSNLAETSQSSQSEISELNVNISKDGNNNDATMETSVEPVEPFLEVTSNNNAPPLPPPPLVPLTSAEMMPPPEPQQQPQQLQSQNPSQSLESHSSSSSSSSSQANCTNSIPTLQATTLQATPLQATPLQATTLEATTLEASTINAIDSSQPTEHLSRPTISRPLTQVEIAAASARSMEESKLNAMRAKVSDMFKKLSGAPLYMCLRVLGDVTVQNVEHDETSGTSLIRIDFSKLSKESLGAVFACIYQQYAAQQSPSMSPRGSPNLSPRAAVGEYQQGFNHRNNNNSNHNTNGRNYTSSASYNNNNNNNNPNNHNYNNNNNHHSSASSSSSSHSGGAKHRLLIMPSPQKRSRTSSSSNAHRGNAKQSRNRNPDHRVNHHKSVGRPAASRAHTQIPKRIKWQRWKDCIQGQEQEWCMDILNTLRNDPCSESFRYPVPDDEVLYHQTIKKPMDLQTMRQKAEGAGYRSISGFLDDFTLIVNNCRSFNDSASVFVEHSNAFESKWKTLVGQNAQEAIDLTSSTLTLRKLNGLKSSYKMAQKRGKKKIGSSRNDTATSTGVGRGRKKGAKRKRATSMTKEEEERKKEGEEDENEKRQPDLTAEDYLWCQQTLIDLTEHPLSLPFLDPVDDTITSYHNVIDRPMDFATMAHNINFKFRGDTTKGLPAKKKTKKNVRSPINHTNNYYRTKTAFVRDVRLIFSNCRKFNAEGSELYADAGEIERALDIKLGIEKHRRRYAANRMSDEASKWCSGVLHQMRCHKDAFPFGMPVDKSLKDYHRKIKKPIDFMTLGRRLHEGMYPDKIAFCNQIKLIFENCRAYNPKTSDLCKMVTRLEKYFTNIVPESILIEEAAMLKKREEEEEARRNAK